MTLWSAIQLLLVGALVGAALLALARFAFTGLKWILGYPLRRRRRMWKRKGRCLHCGYILIPYQVRCPECGHGLSDPVAS